jgi:tetratricopeptide (TPR) repeat protein
MNALEEGPTSSPMYLYSLATLRLQRAMVSVKFGNTWDAAWDFRKAFLLLKENKKKFPNFSPNELMYGSLEALIGTVPKGYKWLANILGMKGSITDGMRRVNQFNNSSDPWAKLFFNQAAFIYPYLLFLIENKKEEALQFIQQKKLDLVNNHLHAFMAANLALGNKQIELSKSIIQNRNKSDEYLTMSVWDYQLGYIKLYHLEYQDARNYFESYTQNFKGKFYIKDAYQKISWIYYLQGNLKSAEEARKQVIKKGSAQSDADKQALKDAKNMYWPNQLLLKARLLNDGGYHSDAFKLLAGKTEDDFDKIVDKLEFAYRAGRIFDDLGKSDEAIKNYLAAIKIGANRREYYAARASLQIAQIYEQKGQFKLAILYYQKCLDMEDHEYKDSIDQKANAGIARCKGE